MNRSLFDALWLEKMAIRHDWPHRLVAAFSIVASLVLLVMEKTSDTRS